MSLKIEWERQQITSKTYLNICRHLAFSGAQVGPVFECCQWCGVLVDVSVVSVPVCECALGRIAGDGVDVAASV